jgi:hypothetical protein
MNALPLRSVSRSIGLLFLAQCCLCPLLIPCYGQSTAKLAECRKIVSKDSESTLSPDVCSVIVAQIGSDERIATLSEDGSFLTMTPDGMLHEHSLPPKLRSTLFLKHLRKVVDGLQQDAKENPQGLSVAMLPDAQMEWSQARDVYCNNHPGDSYTDLSNKEQVCPAANR